MIRRLCFIALGVAAVSVAAGLSATEPQQPKQDKKPVTSKQQDEKDIRELGLKEKALQEKYAKFEQSLQDLHDRLANGTAADKAQAAKLKLALDKSIDLTVTERFSKYANFLAKGTVKGNDFAKLVADSDMLVRDLQEILDLLDGQKTALVNHKDRIKDLEKQLEFLNKLIREEKVIGGQIQTGLDPAQIKENQNDVRQATKDFAKELAKGDKKGDKNDKGNQGGDAKESPSEPKSKQGGEAGEAKNSGKEQKGGENKPGDAKSGGDKKPGDKQGQAKPGENKSGQAGKESKPGDSKPGQGGDSKAGQPKEGKGGEAKAGQPKESQNGQGKEGQAKDGGDKQDKQGSLKTKQDEKKAGGNEKQGDQPKEGTTKKTGEQGNTPKQGQPKPGDQQAGKQQESQPKSGEQQAGPSSQGQSKSGQSSQGQGQPKPGGGQPDDQASSKKQNPKQQDDQQANKGPQRPVDEAAQSMKKVENNVQDPNQAKKDADEAVLKLEEARRRLEELLRQLREEEQAQLLATLISRCKEMLKMQEIVLKGTEAVARAIDANADKKASRTNTQDSLNLSDEEKKIVLEATKAIDLLESEGSAVAFPEAFIQVREDMKHVARRLAATPVDPGKVTQAIEQDIIDSLKEMIKALEKAEQDLKDKKKPKDGQSPPPGPQPDPKLLNKIQELKMVRALQMRVNTRTQLYGREYPGEQADVPAIRQELGNLSSRQERIVEVTNKIVKGDSQ